MRMSRSSRSRLKRDSEETRGVEQKGEALRGQLAVIGQAAEERKQLVSYLDNQLDRRGAL